MFKYVQCSKKNVPTLKCLQNTKEAYTLLYLYNKVYRTNLYKKDSDKRHAYLQMSQDTFNYALHLIQLNLKSWAYENFRANLITPEEILLIRIR